MGETRERQKTASGEYVTAKASESVGKTFKVTSTRTVEGRDGKAAQLSLQLEGGRVAYVSAKSGIAKGVANGKLMLPFSITPAQVSVPPRKDKDGRDLPTLFYQWTLAPRVA